MSKAIVSNVSVMLNPDTDQYHIYIAGCEIDTASTPTEAAEIIAVWQAGGSGTTPEQCRILDEERRLLDEEQCRQDRGPQPPGPSCMDLVLAETAIRLGKHAENKREKNAYFRAAHEFTNGLWSRIREVNGELLIPSGSGNVYLVETGKGTPPGLGMHRCSCTAPACCWHRAAADTIIQHLDEMQAAA